MKAALAARLRRLETHHQTIEDSNLKVTFAKLTILPRSYIGERHRIRIDKGNEGSSGVANYEERPGPGRAIGSDPNVLTVMFVACPGERRPSVE